MKLSLVVAQGNPPGKEIPIRLSQFLIGRDPDCHLRPASPLVSKRHCAILQRDEQVFVRDFNSTNGTFVNQTPLKGERELKSGDELRLGPLVFTVKITDVPASSDTLSDKMETQLSDTHSSLPVTSEALVKTETMPAAPPTKKAGSSAKMPALEGQAKAAPKPAAKPVTRSEDDDIAAMLFNLEGDDSSSATSDQIPQGTTMMEALSPEALAAADAAAAEAEADSKGPEKKGPSNRAKIQDHKATADAAKSILDQYMRRSRNQ